jgi:parvulin-like peptidyl-prolyl isomerase
MHLHTLRLIVPILAVTSLFAACGSGGGSSAKLAANDVAVVGNRHITAVDFNAEMNQAKLSYQQSGQAFPKQGTTQYQAIKSQAVDLLVQQAERQTAAAALGVTVTDQQVDSQLKQIKKQYFNGSEKKYRAQLAKLHWTDAQVRKDLKSQMIDGQVQSKLIKNISVSSAEALAYYQQHKSQYTQGVSRKVQYILVKSKSRAESLYAQLKSGNAKTWCTLAKKYSEDPSSKSNCGKATFAKGQTVKAFDTVLFSQATGVVHAPVYDAQQYKAWFLIRPLSAPLPSKTTPFTQVSSSIEQTLLQQKQKDAVTAWATKLEKSYCQGSKVQYQIGYAPNPDPCTALTTSTNTTATSG